MISNSSLRLNRIDLGNNSRGILASLIELLTPHIPYSLPILGSILNARPRSSALSSIDPSKISLWSTVHIPLCHGPDAVSTTDRYHDALFSIVSFSHLNHQFHFFCSAESRSEQPRAQEAEETHVRQVFEQLLKIASEAHPVHTSILSFNGELARRTATDLPEILVTGVHARWAATLAPLSTAQVSSIRYVCPPRGSPGALVCNDQNKSLSFKTIHQQTQRGSCATIGDESKSTSIPEMQIVEMEMPGMEVSEIEEPDLEFVRASTLPRSDEYILSRAPYSVCLREKTETGSKGRPIACVFMHCDGSFGGLHVDTKYRRHGLGLWIIRALIKKLDFSMDQHGKEMILGDGQDLGGGALGWNWMDTELSNEAVNRLVTSLVGKENMWETRWVLMPVHPRKSYGIKVAEGNALQKGLVMKAGCRAKL